MNILVHPRSSERKYHRSVHLNVVGSIPDPTQFHIPPRQINSFFAHFKKKLHFAGVSCLGQHGKADLRSLHVPRKRTCRSEENV